MYPWMSMKEVERTTLAEFSILAEAYRQRMVDARFLESFGAWQTTLAGRADKNGRPAFRRFTDLFNYKKEMKGHQKLKLDDRTKRIVDVFEKINRR